MISKLERYINNRLLEINDSIRCNLIYGPLISAIAYEYINNVVLNLEPFKFDYFSVEDSSSISKIHYEQNSSILINNNKVFIHEINDKENYSLFLKDWFLPHEQIIFSNRTKKIITTDSFKHYLVSKEITIGEFYNSNKIINFISWVSFLKKNSTDESLEFEKTKEILYYLFSQKINKDLLILSKWYFEEIDSGLFYPEIKINKVNSLINIEPNQEILINNKLNGQILNFKTKLLRIHDYYKIIDFLLKSPKTVRTNLLFLINNGININHSLLKNQLLNKEISKNNIAKFNNTIKLFQIDSNEHLLKKIIDAFFKKNINLMEVMEFFNLINNKFKSNQFRVFINFLHSYDINERIKENSSPLSLYQDLIEPYNLYSREFESILINPIDLSGFKLNRLIKELTTSLDLIIEGDSLSHCVHEYSERIKASQSRIFSIKYRNHFSTLELSNNGKINIIQHKGYKNSEPYWINNLIANHLLKFINTLEFNDFFIKQYENSKVKNLSYYINKIKKAMHVV